MFNSGPFEAPLMQALNPGGIGTTGSATGGLSSSLGGGFSPLGLQQQVSGSIGNLLSSLFTGPEVAKGFQQQREGFQQGIGQVQQSLAQALGLLQPFQQAGQTAIQQELGALGQEEDPSAFINQILGQFQQSPAQQATIQSGLEAVQNRLGAQGLGQSGAEQKALEQFAQQQTAGQQEQFLKDVLGVQQGRIGSLGQLAGLGAGAAGAGASGAIQSGTSIADLLASIGQSQKSQAETQAGGISGLVGSLASLFL